MSSGSEQSSGTSSKLSTPPDSPLLLASELPGVELFPPYEDDQLSDDADKAIESADATDATETTGVANRAPKFKFPKLTDTDKIVESLEDHENMSTEELYARLANVQSIASKWQDEWIELEDATVKKRPPINDGPQILRRNPRAPRDPVVYQDRLEADVYGFKYDGHHTKIGAQRPNSQRDNEGLEVNGRHLRHRVPTQKAFESGGGSSPEAEGTESRLNEDGQQSLGRGARIRQPTIRTYSESRETTPAAGHFFPSGKRRGRPPNNMRTSRLEEIRSEEAASRPAYAPPSAPPSPAPPNPEQFYAYQHTAGRPPAYGTDPAYSYQSGAYEHGGMPDPSRMYPPGYPIPPPGHMVQFHPYPANMPPYDPNQGTGPALMHYGYPPPGGARRSSSSPPPHSTAQSTRPGTPNDSDLAYGHMKRRAGSAGPEPSAKRMKGQYTPAGDNELSSAGEKSSNGPKTKGQQKTVGKDGKSGKKPVKNWAPDDPRRKQQSERMQKTWGRRRLAGLTGPLTGSSEKGSAQPESKGGSMAPASENEAADAASSVSYKAAEIPEPVAVGGSGKAAAQRPARKGTKAEPVEDIGGVMDAPEFVAPAPKGDRKRRQSDSRILPNEEAMVEDSEDEAAEGGRPVRKSRTFSKTSIDGERSVSSRIARKQKYESKADDDVLEDNAEEPSSQKRKLGNVRIPGALQPPTIATPAEAPPKRKGARPKKITHQNEAIDGLATSKSHRMSQVQNSSFSSLSNEDDGMVKNPIVQNVVGDGLAIQPDTKRSRRPPKHLVQEHVTLGLEASRTPSDSEIAAPSILPKAKRRPTTQSRVVVLDTSIVKDPSRLRAIFDSEHFQSSASGGKGSKSEKMSAIMKGRAPIHAF